VNNRFQTGVQKIKDENHQPTAKLNSVNGWVGWWIGVELDLMNC
jgi:hypothetical protein